MVLLLGKVIPFMPTNHKKEYSCTAAMLFKMYSTNVGCKYCSIPLRSVNQYSRLINN